MTRKYQPKMVDGVVNPLYIPQKNRHKRAGEEGYVPHSGGKSKHKSLFDRANFIAWDGEGFDLTTIKYRTSEDKPVYEHAYGLLMNSLGDSIDNVGGLSTLSCLWMITEVAKQNKHAIHVCYGASYDVNMMLRDVPYDDLVQLYNGETIEYDRYQLEYRPRKSFIIRRMPEAISERWRAKKDKDGKENYEKVFESKLTLWDVLGFFQGTFIKAVTSYAISCDLEKIKAGKAKRGAFSPTELENEIKPYCLEEVRTLVKLMEVLHHNLQEAGLKIARWDGAGACASALLKREKIKAHMAECPVPVQKAAQHAYSGGRIEPLMYGYYAGPVYHYDINSAYPYAMLSLPSLASGKWKYLQSDLMTTRITVSDAPTFSMYKVSWKFPENLPLYPFPYRTTAGSILFPPHGKNWVWYPELKAAFDTIPDAADYIEIEEAYGFIPSTNEKPFAFLKDLYTLRAIWKREGNGAEKAMKLAINSLYGKMVQQLGYMKEDADGNIKGKPPYHQLEWGGYVTSYTRAELFRACMQNPTAIISLATDGIYSTAPLDLPCGKELGEWEFHKHDNMTLVTSGVYWYTDNGEEKSFYRGFDAGTLTSDMVMQGWELAFHKIIAASTRFITLGAALLPNGGREAQKKRFQEWRTWKTVDRELSLDMANVVKRLEYNDVDQVRKGYGKAWFPFGGMPNDHLHRTRAGTIRFLREESLPFQDSYTIAGQEVQLLSTPYKLKWDPTSLQEQDAYVEGIPVFEYERQHLDTFV